MGGIIDFAKSLFSKPKRKPAPALPKPKPIVPLPTIDDELIRKKRRRELARLSRKSGRGATIFSDDLGGGGSAPAPTRNKTTFLGG